jgi:hypothetical protein
MQAGDPRIPWQSDVAIRTAANRDTRPVGERHQHLAVLIRTQHKERAAGAGGLQSRAQLSGGGGMRCQGR